MQSEMSSPTSNKNWEADSISDFYKDANIFITGATGFLGKVLLEKLLRSCKSIGTIYVLIKPKKDLDPEQRLKSLLEYPIFNILRESTPQIFEKVKVVRGEISRQNLGLDDADKRRIIEEVNIVFHLAASVRLKGNLKETVMSNVFGTKEIVKLCAEVHQLKSFVYVSTAYSNADKEHIEEIVYDPPYEPEGIIKCVQTLPSHLLEKYVPELIGEHPNIYTFSKALAESIASEDTTRFPTAIVRPSIVNSSWKEPFPGWVDSLGGATGLVAPCALGIVDGYFVGKNICADLVPVDIVVNTIVTAGWHSTLTRVSTKVYNCVSGPINGISWESFAKITQKYIRKYPTQHLIRYPHYTIRENRTIYLFRYFFFRYTIAFIYDVLLYYTKRKPMLMRVCKKTAKVLELVQLATFFKLNFDIKTFRSLLEAVKNAKDGQDFNIDMSKDNGFDWDDYLNSYYLGIRRHIFKDNSSLTRARAKLNRIYWTTKIINVAFILGLFTIVVVMVKEYLDESAMENLV